MPETFAQYIDKLLKHATQRGLNNPLVKMPVKRFRVLSPQDFSTVADGGSFIIGTNADAVSRNLLRNYQTRIRERGEHCGFICCGSVEMSIAETTGQGRRVALFPVYLKRANLQSSGDKIRVNVSDDEEWRFNPVLEAHLRSFGVVVRFDRFGDPYETIKWVKAQLGNRATQVQTHSYVGLFSSQQMVFQERLADPIVRRALARNGVIQAKILARISHQ